jgi:hypothetical protein
MTDRERITRERLLKRAAAVAGAVYVAPALTSVAAAEPESCHNTFCSGDGDCPDHCFCNVEIGYCRKRKVCNGQPCRTNKQCKKKGGKSCKCVGGKCTPPGSGGPTLTL